MFSPNWKLGLQQVADGVYAYYTEGTIMRSNAGFIDGTDCALIFDSLATVSMMDDFLSQCRGVSRTPVGYLVLSHAHGDHCLSAAQVHAPVVIAHRKARAQIAANMERDRDPEVLNRRFPGMDYRGAHFIFPNVWMGDALEIDLGGRTAELYHAGHCHTPEDVYLYLRKEGVVFCGDLLFHRVVPSFHQGNIFQMLQTLNHLISLDADKYVPGHGPLATKEDVRTVREHYAMMLELAQEGIRAGRTAEESVYLLEEQMGPLRTQWAEPERVFVSMECIYAQVQGIPFVFTFDPAKVKKFPE